MGRKPNLVETIRALDEAARAATKGTPAEKAGHFPVPDDADQLDGATGDEVVLYDSAKGVQVQLRYSGHTIWATQKQMADLYGVGVTAISRHLRHIFDEGELDADSVIAESAITAADGKTYEMLTYNLDAIISVGYRVNSKQGTMFRRWATDKLVQYAIKGFALDDERLKDSGGNDYFSELRERIRDIRASEANLYAELRSICSLCSDYDPKSQAAINFYVIMQNKLLWAVATHTAPEIIVERADAQKDNMGLNTWKGKRGVSKSDVTVAKNYLGDQEIGELNRLTGMVLDFFEDQTERRSVVTMTDLETRLDEFLRFNNRSLLRTAGTVSRAKADLHAEAEYAKYVELRRLRRQQDGVATVTKLLQLAKEPTKKGSRKRG